MTKVAFGTTISLSAPFLLEALEYTDCLPGNPYLSEICSQNMLCRLWQLSPIPAVRQPKRVCGTPACCSVSPVIPAHCPISSASATPVLRAAQSAAPARCSLQSTAQVRSAPGMLEISSIKVYLQGLIWLMFFLQSCSR
jgi:hypothetical protein